MEEENAQITEVTKSIAARIKKEKTVVDHALTTAREVVAILFWFYVFLKLFVFDIDIFLVQEFAPNYAWLLDFKFFIFVGAIATIWLVTKSRHIILWTLYIFFYPAIVILWKFPYFVFRQKSWIFAFAVINAVISFFKSLKYNFITVAFFLVALSIIFGFSSPKLLWPSITVLIIILSMIYVHRFFLVFKPSSIFQVHIKIFSGIRKNATSSFVLEEEIKNLPVADLSEKQLEKWTTNLQTSVLFNRVCLFAAKKLRDYQNSGLNIVSYVLTILLLVVLTIFSFAAVNFGLYKINSNMFDVAGVPNFFTFFYYSFNNLLFNSIQEITPITAISQSASMLESFFALFLVAIFISLLISVRSQRHSEELNEVIAGIEEQGADMEGFIRDEYRINSIEDAMAELDKLKAGMAKFLYKITESIK